MKLHEKINSMLLGILWSLAIILGLDFCLNTIYNFNIFSDAHWQYIAEIQASHTQIATGFYISITVAIVLWVSGLYIIFRPRFRKIKLIQHAPETHETQKIEIKNESPTPVLPPVITEQQTETTQQLPEPTTSSAPKFVRPPHLHIQSAAFTAPKQNTQKKEQKKSEPQKQLYTHEIREIFENANYRVINPKPIKKTPISLIALGANETLWIGAVNISHEQMADVMLELKSVFDETLQDIEIDINAFIINPSDNDAVDAILDFDSLKSLSDTISENPNTPESDNNDNDGNSMDAFAGYIETVLTYLGNK